MLSAVTMQGDRLPDVLFQWAVWGQTALGHTKASQPVISSKVAQGVQSQFHFKAAFSKQF